jgi:hypothetical protein
MRFKTLDNDELKKFLKELLKEGLEIELSDASDMYDGAKKAIRVRVKFDGEEIDSDYIDV